MVQKIGSLTSPGIIDFERKIARFEHHKIYIKTTNFATQVTLRIEDKTVALNTDDLLDVVNLNPVADEIITENGTCSFLVENARIDGLQVNFVSGDATIEVFYTGW